MPSWLWLVLAITCMVLWVGVEAALTMGNWRVFWTAVRQYGFFLVALAVPALLITSWVFMFRP